MKNGNLQIYKVTTPDRYMHTGTVKSILLVTCMVVFLQPCTSHHQVTSQPSELFQVSRTDSLHQVDSWKILETSHYTIYYREGHTIFAQEVAELAEDIYEDATSFMRCTPQEKVEIVIFSSDTRFFSWESSYADRAYADSDLKRIILICGCPFSTEVCGWNYLDVKRALSHELNHVLFYWIIEENQYVTEIRSSHQWILEGIATYYEKYPYVATGKDGSMLPVVIQYLEENNDFPTVLEEISFAEYDRLSYPLACSVVEFIFDEYGEEGFHLFLDNLREWNPSKSASDNVEEALEEAFGIAKEEFENQWILYVKEKYPPEYQEFGPAQITYPPHWRVPSSWHGSTILFVSDDYENLDIFVMDENGRNVQQLTADESCDFDPKFSPDGTRIAFTSLRDGSANIYCMDADGSNMTQLTYGEHVNVMSSWSPDGKKIVFTSGVGDYNVYCMDADGSNVTQLTVHEGDDGWPVFSPDGKKIVFVSDRNGSYDLYCMNADGTGITQLTNTPEYENFPAYSPDGKKIAFVSRWETGAKLCIMNADGSGRKTIVRPPKCIVDTMARHRDRIIGYPVWSPDGEEIAFTAVNQIFVVSLEQCTDTRWVVLSLVGCALMVVLVFGLKKRKTGISI